MIARSLARAPPGRGVHVDMGDMMFDDDLASQIRPHTPAVFATNKTCRSPVVHNVPLGIIDLDGRPYDGKDALPLALLRKGWRPLAKRDITVFQPTGKMNNPQRKVPVPGAHRPSSRLSREEFAKTLGNAQMVVCSSGNAPDTYRFWEALYAGAIPIVWGDKIGGVGSGYFWRSYGDILPMINITNISQLERGQLLRRFNDVLSRKWDLRPLLAQYWADRVKSLETKAARAAVS